MEPQTRYVRSADGTRIAVATAGRGRPLMILPTTWLSTIETYWKVAESQAILERLAHRRKVVTYDNRGYGLSERETTDFSLEARIGDLTAVVDALEAPVVDLLAMAYSGAAAISYAASYPERVERLVLSNSVARGRDLLLSDRQRVLRPLIEVDWELYVQTQVLVTQGWTQAGRSVAESLAGALSAEVFLATVRTARQDDVTDLLPQVQCPTLITRPRSGQFVSSSTAGQMAAAIPNARLVLLDQDDPLTLAHEVGMRMIQEFLDEEEGAPREDRLPSGTAVILFADIADSTGLTEQLGDAAFRAKARELDDSMRSAIRDNSGIPIEGKLLGDGVLAVFTSAREAVQTAICCAVAGASAGLPLHLGLHAGDVIREENNVYGGAVNIASRISGLSAPGEVLVSDTVRSLARTSAGVRFEDRGEQALKGVGEAVRVWAVREAE